MFFFNFSVFSLFLSKISSVSVEHSFSVATPMEQFELLLIVKEFLCPIEHINKFFLTNLNLIFFIFLFFFYLFFMFNFLIYDLIIPSRLNIFFISIYNFVENIIVENINLYYYFKNLRFFLFLLFLIIVVSDLSGIIPYTLTITSHLIFTFSLSSLVIFLVNSFLVERYGFVSLRFFLPPGAPLLIAPFLVVIELISYSARVFSLAIRLFANMMSGHILLKIFGEFSFALALLGIPLNILISVFYYLEGLIGILQGYVFLILSCIYIKESIYLH